MGDSKYKQLISTTKMLTTKTVTKKTITEQAEFDYHQLFSDSTRTLEQFLTTHKLCTKQSGFPLTDKS